MRLWREGDRPEPPSARLMASFVDSTREEPMDSSLETAQAASPAPIADVAVRAGVQPHEIEPLVFRFGLPCVVAINRRSGDTDEVLELVRRLAMEAGALRAEVQATAVSVLRGRESPTT
jgi:formyltetrahydrofolate synthetase